LARLLHFATAKVVLFQARESSDNPILKAFCRVAGLSGTGVALITASSEVGSVIGQLNRKNTFLSKFAPGHTVVKVKCHARNAIQRADYGEEADRLKKAGNKKAPQLGEACTDYLGVFGNSKLGGFLGSGVE
jgi:hypothetical protein